MDADVFNRTSEQLCHLALREPNRLVFEADLQPDGLVRLIDDDLVLGFWHDGDPLRLWQAVEEFLRREFHSREGEEGFPQVLERRADMIDDGVVQD